MALHKANVFWETSGWGAKYLPERIIRDMRGRLEDKMMFGSGYPGMPYPRSPKGWNELGVKGSFLGSCLDGTADRRLGL